MLVPQFFPIVSLWEPMEAGPVKITYNHDHLQWHKSTSGNGIMISNLRDPKVVNYLRSADSDVHSIDRRQTGLVSVFTVHNCA